MITIYYDANCPLCCRYRQALTLLAAEQLKWINIHEQNEFSPEELLNQLHVKLPDGSLKRGSEAMTYIIHAIPGAERFSWLIDGESGQRAIDFFHKTSDRLRRRLQSSCPSCQNKRASP